jgi:GxxExxY protein
MGHVVVALEAVVHTTGPSWPINGPTVSRRKRKSGLLAAFVTVGLKAIQCLKDVHKRQTLTYVRLANKKLGILLNFGAAFLRDGIVRVANGMPR